jgi:two-component system OmpR family response regulator
LPELKRVLYVEDEDDIRTVATMALEALGGLEIVGCGSGKEALALAPGARADLLLLDVMMPGLDGPATPVIFMTAKVQASEIEQYRSLGALDVIAKPFDPMTLAEQVKAIWQKA